MVRTALVLLTLSLPAALTALPVNAETRVPMSQAEISMGFAPVVKKATPAVVNIYAKRIVQSRSPFADDPFFSEFFRNFGQGRPQVQNSLGSGVLLSDDGIVVTNFHVVGRADEIRIVLNNRAEYDADVLLADEEADLAILKLKGAHDMPHLTLRDSDDVEVGELVLAVGNPFGVGQTVSSGIVSGLARSGTATGNARGYFIQTDAPINPGNSGGALIDINGDLIGVNTSILSRSGGSNGIGFAIPSALVAQFVDQARDGKTDFERPWAGMTGQPVDAQMAQALGLDLPGGVLISELHDASPFLDAGFQVGDVVMDVDGEPVNTPAEMLFRMTIAGLGHATEVTRFRDGKPQNVTVDLIDAPEEPARNSVTLPERSVIPGLVLERINPAVMAELGLPLSSSGVVVADPGPMGPRAGLKAGDVLQSVNGASIATTEEAQSALADPGRWLELVLLRGGQRMQLRFRL
ncbi:trypsin-like peptidase domain-containing protein [Pseudooceanicola nanhaiensis]|uniref:trypsin-like peptidase domain-containing protein n=1 Tax=Pseudooceanicola nanhaiensis TaxID=375761 RepID=UPI001CD4F317|nr:trypsin-like peptidase domain-containing protein [Pseudooceanicola nanhaiensis]MCA0922713.1 trypsin-like peptidase domain-containing protein [Pseudooceanicola nanhaiensis]